MGEKIKIAIFKPLNARGTNAFYSGQQPVFKYLQKRLGYEITYFIDGDDNSFDEIEIKRIKRDRLKTLFLNFLRRIFGKFKYYWKVPYYNNLDFSGYDILITEGIYYLILDYFKNLSQQVIINDSISKDFILSESQKKYLNRYFSKSLAVVVNDKIPFLYKKNGLKINTKTIGHAIDTEKIIFVKRSYCIGKLVSIGRLSAEKGFEYIIRALALLKNKYPNIKLDIYGEGSSKESLLDLIKSLNLENHVFLKGFLPYDDLIGALKDYDLFVSHSLSVKSWEEYFGMVNLEAMAEGLPVITSDCGGVSYVVKNRAIVVKQKDEKGIADKIDFFIKNPAKVKKYSDEGRRYVEENYSVEVIAKKWDKAIKKYIKYARI